MKVSLEEQIRAQLAMMTKQERIEQPIPENTSDLVWRLDFQAYGPWWNRIQVCPKDWQFNYLVIEPEEKDEAVVARRQISRYRRMWYHREDLTYRRANKYGCGVSGFEVAANSSLLSFLFPNGTIIGHRTVGGDKSIEDVIYPCSVLARCQFCGKRGGLGQEIRTEALTMHAHTFFEGELWRKAIPDLPDPDPVIDVIMGWQGHRFYSHDSKICRSCLKAWRSTVSNYDKALAALRQLDKALLKRKNDAAQN